MIKLSKDTIQKVIKIENKLHHGQWDPFTVFDTPFVTSPPIFNVIGLKHDMVFEEIKSAIESTPQASPYVTRLNGHTWRRISTKSLVKSFEGCFGYKGIRYNLNWLVNHKFLFSRFDLNSYQLDRTRWYAVNYFKYNVVRTKGLKIMNHRKKKQTSDYYRL